MKYFSKISKIELLFIFSLLVAFLYLGTVYFLSDSLQVYDGPGHLNLIWNLKENLWPSFWGWNSSSLLGFDQGVYYPPLFHYSAAALSFLFGIETSVKLIIFTATLLLPISTYFLASKFFLDYKAKIFSSCLILLALFVVPGYLGAGVKALTEIGLLTSFVATPLVLLYLGFLLDPKKPRLLAQTILLSAIILTHFVAGVFCLLTLAISLLIKFLTKNFNWSDFLHPIAAMLLTCFFWFPLILRFEYTSVSVHLQSLSWPNLAVFLLSLALSFSFWQGKKTNLLVLSLVSVFLSLVCLGDVLVGKFLPDSVIFQKLYSLHIYRYQVYGYILALFCTLYWPTSFLFSLKKPKINPVLVASLPLIVLIVLVFSRSGLLVDKVKINVAQNTLGEGRFLETFSREDSYPFIYSSQAKLIEDQNQNWAYGLFTDANSSGPFIGSVIKTLTLTSSGQDTKFTVEDKIIDMKRLNAFLDLFAVGNLIYLDSKQPGRNEGENFFTLKIGDRNLVEYPKQKLQFVENNWEGKVFDWWLEKGNLKTLLVKGETVKELGMISVDHQGPKIVNHNKGWSDFVIDSQSEQRLPILVKFSYSPNWKAFDEQNREIKIYTASPNLMLIFAKGKIHFIYETLWHQKATIIVSLLTLLVGLFLLINKKNVFKV